jgi:hypothetical protein
MMEDISEINVDGSQVLYKVDFPQNFKKGRRKRCDRKYKSLMTSLLTHKYMERLRKHKVLSKLKSSQFKLLLELEVLYLMENTKAVGLYLVFLKMKGCRNAGFVYFPFFLFFHLLSFFSENRHMIF